MKHQNLLAAVLFTAVAILPTASKAASDEVLEAKVGMCRNLGSLTAATINTHRKGVPADKIRGVVTSAVLVEAVDRALRQGPEVDVAQYAMDQMAHCILNAESFTK